MGFNVQWTIWADLVTSRKNLGSGNMSDPTIPKRNRLTIFNHVANLFIGLLLLIPSTTRPSAFCPYSTSSARSYYLTYVPPGRQGLDGPVNVPLLENFPPAPTEVASLSSKNQLKKANSWT